MAYPRSSQTPIYSGGRRSFRKGGVPRLAWLGVLCVILLFFIAGFFKSVEREWNLPISLSELSGLAFDHPAGESLSSKKQGQSLDLSATKNQTRPPPEIIKVSMLFGQSPELYEAAIKTHEEHNQRWNYGMEVLRQNVWDKYWSKLFFMLGLMAKELAKAPADRAKWLMWVDADVFLINPSIPLQTFLPEDDLSEINLVVSKDHNGLNTGIFFIRVDKWSAQFMTKALAFPMFRGDVDLGHSYDQQAMALLLQEEEMAKHTLYQPRIWHNAYEFHHGYEGKPGRLLVHFPGLEEDRWPHMRSWLQVLNGPQAKDWDIPAAESMYATEVPHYWAGVRQARQLTQDILTQYKTVDQMPGNVKEKWLAVVSQLRNSAHETDNLEKASHDLSEARAQHM